ncbi:transposable element Tcb2 transposase [Trichonephila clavipes]|nr:transposable element Tcb2 transposase [Trichonephila clavipes]
MYDNAQSHRTLAVEELLESEDITRMDWSAYSPDLNPIEHVWDVLGRRIAARLHHPENTQQLKQMLIEEWALLPQEMLHQLVLSMRKRCEATIAKLVNYQCKSSFELLVLHPTKNKIVECGISVDGTWQRRGYSSMNGCVAALSVDTGKVVDIEIMASYCPTCRKISKMPRSIESETLQQIMCHSNFQGSALKMEAVGATRILQRSIVKRGLKYAHYYGDGDSKGLYQCQRYLWEG